MLMLAVRSATTSLQLWGVPVCSLAIPLELRVSPDPLRSDMFEVRGRLYTSAPLSTYWAGVGRLA